MSGGELAALVLFGGGALIGLTLLPGIWVGRGRGGTIDTSWAVAFGDSERSRLRALRSFPVGIATMAAGVVMWLVGVNSQSETTTGVAGSPFVVLFITYTIVYFWGRPRLLIPPRYRNVSGGTDTSN